MIIELEQQAAPPLHFTMNADGGFTFTSWPVDWVLLP
jgi:hypothetical protein